MHHDRKWLPLGVIGLTGLLITSGLVREKPPQTIVRVLSPFMETKQFKFKSLEIQPISRRFDMERMLRIKIPVKHQVQNMTATNKTEITVTPVNDSFDSENIANSRIPGSETENSKHVQNDEKSVQVAQTMPKPAQQPTQSGQATPSTQISRGSNEVDKLIDHALSLRGILYRWGGTTRDGFDCSGFVQYVFKGSGIALPRTSFEQFKVGTPVSREQLQSGDLVFFSTYSKGASDVRIYIGDGRTIGAANDGVAIHSLTESYWAKRYLGARRIHL